MRQQSLLVSLVAPAVLVALSVGCSQTEATAKADSQAPAAETANPAAATESTPAAEKSAKTEAFGEPITLTDTVTMASLMTDPGKYDGQTVRTEGTVSAVCKKAGCWMEITDENGDAHVKMAGHSFFVPKDCDGRKAVVQGTIKAGEPENQCGAKDGCMDKLIEEKGGKVAKVEIVATGVELL